MLIDDVIRPSVLHLSSPRCADDWFRKHVTKYVKQEYLICQNCLRVLGDVALTSMSYKSWHNRCKIISCAQYEQVYRHWHTIICYWSIEEPSCEKKQLLSPNMSSSAYMSHQDNLEFLNESAMQIVWVIYTDHSLWTLFSETYICMLFSLAEFHCKPLNYNAICEAFWSGNT